MKKIRYVESIEERPIDRDYNEHGKKRQTHYEVFGGGIAYCVRSGYQPEIVFIDEEYGNNFQDGRQ